MLKKMATYCYPHTHKNQYNINEHLILQIPYTIVKIYVSLFIFCVSMCTCLHGCAHIVV